MPLEFPCCLLGCRFVLMASSWPLITLPCEKSFQYINVLKIYFQIAGALISGFHSVGRELK